MKADHAIHVLMYNITIQEFFILSAIDVPAQEGAKLAFSNCLAELNSSIDFSLCLAILMKWKPLKKKLYVPKLSHKKKTN